MKELYKMMINFQVDNMHSFDDNYPVFISTLINQCIFERISKIMMVGNKMIKFSRNEDYEQFYLPNLHSMTYMINYYIKTKKIVQRPPTIVDTNDTLNNYVIINTEIAKYKNGKFRQSSPPQYEEYHLTTSYASMLRHKYKRNRKFFVDMFTTTIE